MPAGGLVLVDDVALELLAFLPDDREYLPPRTPLHPALLPPRAHAHHGLEEAHLVRAHRRLKVAKVAHHELRLLLLWGFGDLGYRGEHGRSHAAEPDPVGVEQGRLDKRKVLP